LRAARTSKRHAPTQRRYPSVRRTIEPLKEEWQAPLPLPAQDGQKTKSLQATTLTKLNGGFSDSAFADNKQKPIHRWVPWIAGFSSEFVQDAFKRYLPADSRETPTVLDPFCGVGTTLVEALRRGYGAIGFEINPYAALAVRAKSEAAAVSPDQLDRYLKKFEEAMRRSASRGNSASVPEHFKSRIPFFGPLTQVKVLRALHFLVLVAS